MKAGPRQPAGRMIAAGSSLAGSAPPPARFTPIAAQARTGFSTVVSAWSSGKFCGRNTSSAAGRPGRKPMPRRKFAAEAKASGMLFQMSMRPLPSRSTRVLGEGRGHELHVAHRAGPRALHLLRGHVVVGEDAQRLHGLVAEELGALGHAGERRHRAQRREIAHVAAVVGLDAPEGDEILRRHAVLALQRIEQAAILRRASAGPWRCGRA